MCQSLPRPASSRLHCRLVQVVYPLLVEQHMINSLPISHHLWRSSHTWVSFKLSSIETDYKITRAYFLLYFFNKSFFSSTLSQSICSDLITRSLISLCSSKHRLKSKSLNRVFLLGPNIFIIVYFIPRVLDLALECLLKKILFEVAPSSCLLRARIVALFSLNLFICFLF